MDSALLSIVPMQSVRLGGEALGFTFPEIWFILTGPKTLLCQQEKQSLLGGEWDRKKSPWDSLWMSVDLLYGIETPVLGSKRQALGPGSLGFSLAFASCQFCDMEKKVSNPSVPQFSHL